MVSIRAVAAFACFVACLFVATSAEFVAEDHTPVMLPGHVISLINSGNYGWKAASYPQFEGMTLAQARKFLGGHRRSAQAVGYCNMESRTDLPDDFDGRIEFKDCVHPIRDQQKCGSCWAFAASEVLSDRFCIASEGKIDVVLSPQDMVSCDKRNYGCEGGYLDRSWEFLEKTGIVTDECMPYVSGGGNNGKCNYTTTNECDVKGVTFKKYFAKKGSSCTARNVDQIRTMIATDGPIEAAFEVYQDFFSYRSGVYSHKYGGLAGGHAVKCVGWGVEESTKTPYWIIANSWGKTWGEDGFFRILRGNDECGIESEMIAGLAQI